MATKSEGPVTIKKYANRRLYNTGTSTYVTLEDLATMVKNGEDFAVFDAKTGEDITRSVLTQIIFEQENKEGAEPAADQVPAPADRLLRRRDAEIRAAYLEVSLESFTREQEKFRQQISQAFGVTPFGPIMEEQVRRNMEMFKQAFSMFTPFARHEERGRRRSREAGRARVSVIGRATSTNCASSSTTCARRSTSSATARSKRGLEIDPLIRESGFQHWVSAVSPTGRGER